MTIDITDTSSFAQARRVIYKEIEDYNGIYRDYKVANNTDMNMTIARAISVITLDQSKPNSFLKTIEEKKMVFKQLTQKTVLSYKQQKQILFIFLECRQNNTFKPNHQDDEFEALSSMELGTSLTYHLPDPKLSREELSQLDFENMYRNMPTPHSSHYEF